MDAKDKNYVQSNDVGYGKKETNKNLGKKFFFRVMFVSISPLRQRLFKDHAHTVHVTQKSWA